MTRQPVDGGIGLHRAKVEIEQQEAARYKFRFFFAALIFAILSFAIQHPINNSGWFLKIIEIFSWFILFLSGYFSLVFCSGVRVPFIHKWLDKLKKLQDEDWLWLSFYGSLFLLLCVKGLDRF